MASILTKMKNDLTKINENVFLLSNPDNMYAIKSYTDTGCFVLNAVLSDGDIKKGLPDGKRVMLAGKASTTKSYLTVRLIKTYLETWHDSFCLLFEAEGATIIEMAKAMKFTDALMDRIIVIPVETVEDVITQFTVSLDKIIKENELIDTKNNKIAEENKKKKNKDKQKSPSAPVRAIAVLDSLGMLSTRAEQASALDGTNKADAGRRNKLIKSLARTITMKITKVNMPFIVVNHVYANISGYGGGDVISGGGVHYMQDIMLMLSKSKDKAPNKEQVGNIINTKVYKSRFMIENKSVKINLNFETGLDKWSDIVTLGQKYDIIEKSGKDNYLINGEEVKMQAVKSDPAKFINDALLQEIGKAIQNDFSFGTVDDTEGV